MRRGKRRWLLIRLALESLIVLILVFAAIPNSLEASRRNNVALASHVSTPSLQSATVRVVLQDLNTRWFGSPTIWQPPPIPNAEILYFDVKGTSQRELIKSLAAANLCTTHGPCSSDPAVPNGVAWALEWFHVANDYYYCYSPRTTTIAFRHYVLLPRWSPLPLGGVRESLVETWNALLKVLYVHEAGHVSIAVADIAALNDQAHQLASCDALDSFWSDAHVFDKLNADQADYHARLHADCRPEIGCIPAGWMGW
jgi:predicted secreted Zn-dependent protease